MESEPIYQVKLLAALRSGDPALIHPFLAEICKDKKTLPVGSSTSVERFVQAEVATTGEQEIDTGAAALHLAIRCASVETVALLLAHRAISPNGTHPPGSGTTPLHLAASLGRVDIVNLLLEQDSIDDTLRDGHGRTVKEVAKNKQVIRAIDDSRSLLNATFRSQLHSYIHSPYTPSASTSHSVQQHPSPSGLVSLLESPRARYIDLSYLDEDPGTSLLHEAARRKDLRLIELAVRAGADVFVRNRKGKTAYEGAGKDDPVRVFLRQYANHDNTLIHSPNNELPTLKGYLNKYTNVAKGYNTRWFVLCNGVLSYYRHQEDETVTSRGSISMKNATLKSTNDRLRFEVHSVPTFRTKSFYTASPQTPTDHRFGAGDSPLQTSIPSPGNTKDTGGGGTQKWYMKANHPVEAARWTTAIERSIQYFKREALKEREKAEKDREPKGIGAGLGFGLGSISDMEMGIRKSVESDMGHHRSAHKSLNSFSATPDLTHSGKSTNALGTPGGSGSNQSQTLSSLPSFLRKAARSGGNMVREVRDKASLSKDMSKSWGTISGGHAAKDSAHSISMFAPEAVHSLDPSATSEPTVTSDGAYVGGGEDEREDYLDRGMEEAEEDVSSLADSISRGATKDSPPYENGFILHANSVTAQLELTMQLAASLSTLPPSSFSPIRSSSTSSSSKSQLHQPSSSVSSKSPLSSPPQPSIQLSANMQLHSALADSLSTLHDLVRDYDKMVNERERWFKKKLDEEKRRQKVWEESLKVVVKEGEDLEKELKKRSRRRGSAFLGVGVRPAIGATVWSGGDQETTLPLGGFKVVPTTTTTGIVGAIKELPTASGTEASTRVASPSMAEQPEKEITLLPAEKTPRPKIQTKSDGIVPGRFVSQGSMLSSPPATSLNTISKISRRSSMSVPVASPAAYEDGGEAYITDEEDEFFDAIESNTLPNLVVHASLAPTPSSLSRVSSISPLFDVACYSGYEKLRPRLKLSADNRPSTSLWSVLKGSIGKDLTKISFPVFFNEPTSMLQRMAEDMEFSECLDIAAKESDPLMRTAYVAAFAMSNYSSTIGRIAKPFNPMLSETFEYVRLDKQYRYMSEQVSHHPPISACWSESPLWCYHGEVDAQNKFMGKSFEIRPTGIAHVELILPESLGPGYPKASYKYGAGKVKEHYTWKKVTTNVSGFIFGSPTIDHYGDMVVTNHRTGDQCVLTFKPRGWRGKDAYEITGRVTDKDGNEVYDIAGRWNSQLVAKRCDHENGILDPDMKVHSPIHDGSNSPLAGSTEFILLWRNSEKPKGSPFNLTPFAITLNDCPRETLRPYLAPTDCRLRPDQRAFELGKYDLANTLKIMQEEKQRAVRKAREEGRVPPHRPRWFVAETDGDTGERVWSPLRIKDGGELEYWVQRERVYKEGGGTEKWTGMDDIFIEEPQEIKGF